MHEPAPIRGWREALDFAARHHGDALRKGTRSPYLTHVVEVAETLAYHYPERDELIVAGLLHDVVEDTAATFDAVRGAFGVRVERLVRAVSKDDEAMGPAASDGSSAHDGAEARRVLWRRRREFMLSHVRGPDVDPDVLRLKAADAHANLSSLVRDLLDPRVGAAVWERFHVGRSESLWYYREVTDAVREGIGDEPLARRLGDALTTVERRSVASAVGRIVGSGATEGVSVRVASLADVDAIAPLLDAYRRFYGQSADASLARSFLTDRLTRGESTVLVAEGEDGAALGFVQLFDGHSTVRAAPILVLNDLFVESAARGRGVGRLLMMVAERAARELGAAKLHLKTATTNATAQALYESSGWRRVDDFFEYERVL